MVPASLISGRDSIRPWLLWIYKIVVNCSKTFLRCQSIYNHLFCNLVLEKINLVESW